MRPADRQPHSRLLTTFHPGPARRVDAVVVAAWRPTHHIASAAELAADLGCELVAMCSGKARPSEFAALATEWPDLRWHALSVPEDYGHPLLDFASSGMAEDGRHGLLSTKRNIGLLLARMLGWRTVFFLDDDIVEIDPGLVGHAARGLGRLAAVALTVEEFPDNSVVCHANRLGGGRQEVFVGGSALLVDPTLQHGFFPHIYNEDWLYLYEDLTAGRVAGVGSVGQLRYDPFADPERAAAEEFGEIVAEGMVHVLHDDKPAATLGRLDYWDMFLIRRQGFLTEISERIRAYGPPARQRDALRAVAAAEQRRSEITAASCVDYVAAWRADLRSWRDRLATVGQTDSFSAATDHLDLTSNLISLTP